VQTWANYTSAVRAPPLSVDGPTSVAAGAPSSAESEQLAILTTQQQHSVTLLNRTAQTFGRFDSSLAAANGQVCGKGGRHLTAMLEAMTVRETSEDDRAS
jgi:hypothetical protein